MAKHKQKRYVKRRERLVFALLLLIFIWFIGSGLVSFVTNMLVKTTTIGAAYQEVTYPFYAFVDGQKTVLRSPAAGEVVPLCKEGERVVKNHGVYRVTAGAGQESADDPIVYAPTAGIVTYRIHGLEEISGQAEISQLSFPERYKEQGKEQPTKKTTKAGEIYGKILDNLQPVYLYLKYDANAFPTDKAIGDRVKIRALDQPSEFWGTISEIIVGDQQGAENLWVIDCGLLPDALLQEAILKGEIVTLEKRATILPTDAMIYRDGRPGVFVSERGKVRWREVTVARESGNQVTIEGLAEGSIVITNPRWVDEGEIITKR